jgi:hypothetical protein
MLNDDMKLSKEIFKHAYANMPNFNLLFGAQNSLALSQTKEIETFIKNKISEKKDMANNDLLKEREKTHGDFFCNSLYSQSLKMIMKSSKNWEGLSEFKKESLEMIVHKIGRILAGDSNCEDHWDDISGYAQLVSIRLEEISKSDPTLGRVWCEKKE